MLSTRCPRCHTEIRAPNLRQLSQAVRSHCKVKQVTATPVATVTLLPELPWSITLPVSPKSQNLTTYSHWSVYKKDKTRWRRLLLPQVSRYRALQLSYSEWSVTRFWKHPLKEMDFANFVGGCKPLIDILVQEGIIQDDSPRHFKCDYRQQRADTIATVLTLHSYQQG